MVDVSGSDDALTTSELIGTLGAGQPPVVALADQGTFVPVEASYSSSGGFAVAAGVPIPRRWVDRG